MPGFHFPFSVCTNSAAPWFGWGARGDAADALLWACVPKVRCQPVSRTAGADQWSPLRCVCTVSVGEGSPLPLLGVSTLLPVGRRLLPPPFVVIKSLTAGAYGMPPYGVRFSPNRGVEAPSPTEESGSPARCSHKPVQKFLRGSGGSFFQKVPPGKKFPLVLIPASVGAGCPAPRAFWRRSRQGGCVPLPTGGFPIPFSRPRAR